MFGKGHGLGVRLAIVVGHGDVLRVERFTVRIGFMGHSSGVEIHYL